MVPRERPRAAVPAPAWWARGIPASRPTTRRGWAINASPPPASWSSWRPPATTRRRRRRHSTGSLKPQLRGGRCQMIGRCGLCDTTHRPRAGQTTPDRRLLSVVRKISTADWGSDDGKTFDNHVHRPGPRVLARHQRYGTALNCDLVGRNSHVSWRGSPSTRGKLLRIVDIGGGGVPSPCSVLAFAE